MPLTDRKQRDFKRREEDILSSALELLSTPGWESVTIDAIAKKAEIGKGTVYKHFASKDELLFQLMLRFYQGLLTDFHQNFSDEKDFLAQFRAIIEYTLRYHLDNRDYRYIVEYCNRIDFKERAEPSWMEAFHQLDKAFAEWSDPMLKNAMQQRLIQQRPVEQIHLGMRACLDGAINILWANADWCVTDGSEQVVDSITEFMMAALIGQKTDLPKQDA